MSHNEVLMVLACVSILGLVILGQFGSILLRRIKADRSKRILKAASERAREADLLARYRRYNVAPAVDMAALEAELAMEFCTRSVEQGVRFQ